MTHAGQRLPAEELERRLVLRRIAEDLDLLEVVHDDGLEAMMPADRLGGFACTLEGTRIDLVDFEGRKRRADKIGLLLAELAERRIGKLPERPGEVEHLMRMADEQDLGNELSARQECDIERTRPSLACGLLIEESLRLEICLSFVGRAQLRHHDLRQWRTSRGEQAF